MPQPTTVLPPTRRTTPHRLTSPKVIDGRGTLNADTWRESDWTFRL
ncbi:hypothetical protein ACFT7S_35660 [Streptomyces sp. NPDC057136]